MNDRIRAPQVRLVGPDGGQIGIVSTDEALRQARALDLDLVEVAAAATPPVARIMDYGKYKYERDIRQKEARKKQARIEVKEIKFRPKIDPHDYETKKGHVVRFLRAGSRVKVTIMFRGREMVHQELGHRLLDQLATDVADLARVDVAPKLDGRNMTMVLGPLKDAVVQKPAPAPAAPARQRPPRPEPEAAPEPPKPKRPIKVTRAEGG
ncbi:MAG TPA: translation initiation factor IF-3 [Actinomycetota bacterium]|nr:translation initiation factor IF-3 [Actinomycetota bacterium]